jgi:hypothetical protein
MYYKSSKDKCDGRPNTDVDQVKILYRDSVLHAYHALGSWQASLTEEHLEDILKTSTTNMVLEYEKLTADKKCNVSH